MPLKHRREGWLLIDHSNSPGVPEELVRASGKDAPVVGPGQKFESAFNVCCHCGVTVILNPDRSRARGYCRSCDDYVCDDPVCNSVCTPRLKTFELLQEQAFRKEVGLNPLVPAKVRGI
jgi:hypothetical protein